jgi:hypothetical protein
MKYPGAMQEWARLVIDKRQKHCNGAVDDPREGKEPSGGEPMGNKYPLRDTA